MDRAEWRLRSPQERAGLLLAAGAAAVAALTLLAVLIGPPSRGGTEPLSAGPAPVAPTASAEPTVAVGVHATAAEPVRTSARPTTATTTKATSTPEPPVEAEDVPESSPSPSAPATTAAAPPAPPVTYTGTVEGEAAAFSGPDARAMNCGFCSGGRIAGWIGFTNALTFTDVRVAATKTYQLTITYVGDDRSFYVSVNGGPGTRVALFQGSWNEARAATLQITLNAGTANTIRFYNTSDWTPDLDKITID